MVVIVGFNGAMGSGKDTAADRVQQHAAEYGARCRRIRRRFLIARLQFAWALRESVQVLTRGVILAAETRTAEQKARLLPDGCFGRTLGEFLDRIEAALLYASTAGGLDHVARRCAPDEKCEGMSGPIRRRRRRRSFEIIWSRISRRRVEGALKPVPDVDIAVGSIENAPSVPERSMPLIETLAQPTARINCTDAKISCKTTFETDNLPSSCADDKVQLGAEVKIGAIDGSKEGVQVKLPRSTLLEAARRLLSSDAEGGELTYAASGDRTIAVLGRESAISTPRITVGRLLQLFGTEVGRQLFADDVWVRPVGRQMERAHLAIVTDVRFPNELDFLRSKGGLVFAVDASKRLSMPSITTPTAAPAAAKAGMADSKQPEAKSGVITKEVNNSKEGNADNAISKDGRNRGHASETALRQMGDEAFAGRIDNNGTLDELHAHIRDQVWPLIVRHLDRAIVASR